MNKKNKKLITFIVLLIGLFFLLGEVPDNSRFTTVLNSVSENNIVIVFNSGGWGNTPFEKADDLRPIIEGIQHTLNELGYSSVIAPYNRTKENFLGIIEGVKEVLTSFKKQSQKLASEMEYFIENNPKNKVIVVGLSNGATFVNRVIKEIPKDKKSNVFAIEIGTPFWETVLDSDNVLLLDNNGQDSLSNMDLGILLSSLIKAPFRWSLAKISGKELAFGNALKIQNHYYNWDEVAPEVESFLKEKFVLKL